MKNILVFLFSFCLSLSTVIGQNLTVEGYVFETGNRGYLNMVAITITDAQGTFYDKLYTDVNGFFTTNLPFGNDYIFSAYKDVFDPIETELKAVDQIADKKSFINIKMKRSPGYQFEVTLANSRENDLTPVDGIKNARIEVYNNTTEEEVLVLENHNDPTFILNMSKGNHYTILVRKQGYLSKRMEAFVNIDDCILCFEGVGEVKPGVADNLTEGNEMGVLLANVEMDSIYSGKKIRIKDIYYELNKYRITSRAKKSLKNLAVLLNDNPDLRVELSAHTDSRGDEDGNFKLSDKRANAARDWLIEFGNVDDRRIYANGYGESSLTNECKDGVKCSEAEHAANRRTELKIIGFNPRSSDFKSLADMKREERMERMLLELQNEEQIVLEAGQTIEDVINNTGQSEEDQPHMNSSESLEKKASDKVMKLEEALEEEVTDEVVFIDEAVTEQTTLDLEDDEIALSDFRMDSIVNPTTVSDSSIELIDNEDSVVTDKNEMVLEGFKLVIKETEEPLHAEDEIYNIHKNLVEYKEAGIYYYLIGDFRQGLDGDEFLKTVKLNYPKAYMVQFKDGVMIK